MFLTESGDSMFSKIFILIGGIFLSLLQFFKNISLPDINEKQNQKSNINANIFSKLYIQTQPQTQNKQENKIDKIREEMFKYLINKKIMIILIIMLIIISLIIPLEVWGMLLISILMIYFFILYYPKIKQDRSYDNLTQELPYALRHIGVELKAGRGLHDALNTIKNADYGSLSDEFKRVLEEVKYGASTEEALMSMSHRVKSDGLSRATHQIIGTIRVGGNLATSLDIIAQDISFDMHIKLKEYSQKLNSFILIYTFIAILAPVITLIMLMAGSTVMGDVLSPDLLIIIYTVFFPLIVMFMGIFIKKLEPKI